MSATRLSTDRILEELGKMDERPWPEWKHGRPITAVQLARALRPFRIRPKTVREQRDTFKGYDRDDCVDAWARYLPAEEVAPEQPASAAGDDGGFID